MQFMTVSFWILRRTRNVTDKSCGKNQTHIRGLEL